MSIEKRTATSTQMQKNKKAVQLMSKKLGFDENAAKVNWKAIRPLSDFGYRFMPRERSVTFRKATIGGVPCVIAQPPERMSDNVFLYIHGGGFVSGSAGSSKGYCSMLAKHSGCSVVAVDYSLSPESKYPTALNQCVSVYNAITERRKGCKIAICGESAGGSLTLTTALRIMADGGVKPACVMAHSPFVDFSSTIDRHIHEVNDVIVREGCAKPLGELYGCEDQRTSPFVSPVFGDYTDFPPILLTVDTNETLYADSLAIYEKAKECGVDVRMIEMKGAFHAFATLGTGSPETLRIIKECVEMFRENF